MLKEILSIQSSPKVDIEDSMSTPSLLKNLLLKKISIIAKPSATAESPPQNKKTTSIDKSKNYNKNSQMPISSKTSAPDLTSKEKVLKPYWNEFCKEKNLELWLPTKIDLLDSVMTSSINWSNDPVGKSWFSTILLKALNLNSPKTSLTSFMYSPAECTDLEDTQKKLNKNSKKKSKANCSRKIRIYPTKEQQNCFLYWFAGNRAAYNITNEYLKQKGTIANWKNIKTDLLNILSSTNHYLDNVPYQIKSLAIKECCLAVQKAKRDFKKTGKYQEVSFKRIKNPIQSCYIPKSAIKKNSIYVNIVSTYIANKTNTKKDKRSGSLDTTEKFPKNPMDSRLVLESGRWFLCISYEEKINPQLDFENNPIVDAEIQGKKVVSLDPGIRSFITFYSLDSCGKLGEGAFTEIQKLGFELDFLLSLKKKTSNKLRFKKRNFSKVISRIRHRIKDLIREMHHKVALFLVQNFDIILMPKFETQQMVTKNSRKLNSKTARNMMTFSFYKFSLILKDKARRYGRMIVDVTEEYTSKTVSWNGEIKEKLGSARWITSEGIVMDRDYNGARGIMLKWLSDLDGLGRSPFIGSDEPMNKSATSSPSNINNI